MRGAPHRLQAVRPPTRLYAANRHEQSFSHLETAVELFQTPYYEIVLLCQCCLHIERSYTSLASKHHCMFCRL